MKRALSGAASPMAKRQKVSSGKFVTNGFADPLRNYTGSYTSKKPGPAKASVSTPKPSVSNGKVTKKSGIAPKRTANGTLSFSDQPSFKPNLTPGEVLKLGSFGGTYFRDIHSAVLKKDLSGRSQFTALPFRDWGLVDGAKIGVVGGVKSHVNKLVGQDFSHTTLLHSNKHDKGVNRFNAKCGGSLDMWESSGWINAEDPYGWFQWYCWFYLGRRTSDDARQIKRWEGAASEKSGRFLRQVQNLCAKQKKKLHDPSVSPVIRQTLQHWGVDLR